MRSEKVFLKYFRTGVQLPSSPLTKIPVRRPVFFYVKKDPDEISSGSDVRSTGLEPVPVAGHAPQTCAYADSATTADEQMNYTARQILCQELNPIDG